MNWFLAVTVIYTCFNIFITGQNIQNRGPDLASRPHLPGSLADSHAEFFRRPVQVQGDRYLHRHGSVVHSHPYTRVHTHPHLPEPSEPVQSDPHLHRHGSVIHSHPYTTVHTHPNLPYPSEPVQMDPYLHRHGSVIHSHPYVGVHTHPDLPHPSEPVHNDRNLHRHGSVVHSHPNTGVHTHPRNPQTSEPVRRIQHDHDPSITESGSIIHSHIPNNDFLPVNDLQNEHRLGHPSSDFNSAVDLPIQSPPVTGNKDTHSHGPVVHSHDGASIPNAHQTLSQNSDQGNVLQNEPGRDLVSPIQTIPEVHSHTNLRRPSQPVPGSSDTHSHGNIIHTHHGGSNTHSHRTTAHNSQQGFDAVGESSRRRPDIRWLPSYTLAGGQACNTQCENGIAPRYCACSRFMCYYLGCSSRCSLVQDGDYTRATCQPFVDVPNNQVQSSATLSRCDELLDPGNCNSRILSRYGYSARSGKCIRFFYSGCGGNRNRFSTRNACKRACN